jgi:hypothetical protein
MEKIMLKKSRYILSIIAVLTLALGVTSCGKKKKGESKKAPLTDLNKFKLKTHGKDKITFEGNKEMKTAIWTNMGGYSMIAFVPKKVDGCPTLNDLKDEIRMSITLPKMDTAILKGEKPLPKSVKPQAAVILHKGFNRVFMGMGKNIGKVSLTSKILKVGGFVEGTINIDGGDKGKFGFIKGNFKVKVCKP